MIINAPDYSDFLSFVKGIGGVRKVFYRSEEGLFIVFAFVADGKIGVNAGDIDTEPASFSTDFPDAVLIVNNFSVSI